MIPIKIELQNFLSYGAQIQTVTFQEHPLICLSGKNGHGKSALLDAITWSIWGQARKISGSSKPDEGLLRLGQTYMMVSIQFLFNNDHYRIRREFTKSKSKNTQTLDFEIYDAIGDRFIALTDKTIRATQAKINGLLRLDYTTFINSAFIRQGQSNEFSQKSPKERKEILATILNLNQYDELKAKALERARSCQEKLNISRELSARAGKEIEGRALLRDEMRKEKKHLVSIESLLNNNHKALTILEKEKVILIERRQKYAFLKQEILKLQEAQKEKLTKFHSLAQQWRDDHYALLALSKPDVLEKQLGTLRKDEQNFYALQRSQLVLQKKRIAAQTAFQKKYELQKTSLTDEIKCAQLALEKQRLVFESKQCGLLDNDKRLVEIEKVLKKTLPLSKTLDQEVASYELFQKNQQSINAQYEKRKAFYHSLTQRGNWTQAQLQELRRKQGVVQDRSNPACPLCDQMLSARRKQFLHQKFQGKEVFYIHRVHRIGTILKSLKEILITQHHSIEKTAKELVDLARKISNLRAEHATSMQLSAEYEKRKLLLVSQKKECNDLESVYAIQEKKVRDLQESLEVKLARDLQLVGLKDEEKQIDILLDKNNYDEDGHKKVLLKISQVQQQLARLSDIASLHVKQKSLLQQVHESKKSIKYLRQEILLVEKELKELEKHVASYNICIDKEKLLKKEIELNQEKKQLSLQAVSRIQTLLDRIASLEKEEKVREKEHAQCELELQDYQKLQVMFGKDGLQALLIEEAIPEIETEANKILGRLTDNRAHILIESLRDLKKGGVKETLNIQISDTSGIRPYEMFSGGEAFRIDFALRIAISKLLAHRSGTSLQTLIIDEGFGSQDDEGLSRLMDAIHAIQHDFARIIIVSHLPIFKDNFPVHLMIEKGAAGSVVSVVERG